jgi:two-component sensor histidine kinase
LTSETWEGAQLDAIINRALEPFQEEGQERIKVDGPGDMWLDATKAVIVAMVIHELATNAIKYGSLSNGSGFVNVSWEQLSQPDRVKLIWQESGGPKVDPPTQKGFGSHLIERVFRGMLGTSELVFERQGLSCTLEVAR